MKRIIPPSSQSRVGESGAQRRQRYAHERELMKLEEWKASVKDWDNGHVVPVSDSQSGSAR